jgi:1-acyl-sn-glycerol-3-phosphate acyltransferase
MMSILLRPFRILYVLYALITFVLLMIPVFLWSLIVLPFGRVRGGNLVYYGCIVWADIWFLLVFIRHRNIFLEPWNRDQSYIFVANHISYLDSAIIPKTFRHPVRPLGKVEMTRIPVFGFIYKNAIVTVDRSNPANRAKSVQRLKALLRKGISILVFPEGTFNMTHRPLKEFYDGAFRIAIETGTPIRPVLLLNAYDRMHYRSIFSLNPGKSRSIFLPAIPVEGLGIDDVGRLKERVFAMMEEELVKRKAGWISEAQGKREAASGRQE